MLGRPLDTADRALDLNRAPGGLAADPGGGLAPCPLGITCSGLADDAGPAVAAALVFERNVLGGGGAGTAEVIFGPGPPWLGPGIGPPCLGPENGTS